MKPTREEVEQIIIDRAKFWWPDILFSGEVAENVVDALVERGLLTVSNPRRKTPWDDAP